MVGALVRTGVISNLAHAASHATGGNLWLTTMLILGRVVPVQRPCQ